MNSDFFLQNNLSGDEHITPAQNVSINESLKHAQQFQQKGKHLEAEKIYRHVLKIIPDNWTVHLNLSSIYLITGHPRKSLFHIKKVLQIKPETPQAYINLGSARKALGQLNDSLMALEKARQLAPDSHHIHYLIGNHYKNAGQNKKALKAYAHALTLKPDFFEAYYNQGILYTKIAQWHNAMDSFSKAFRLKQNIPELHNWIGIGFQNTGHDDQALSAFNAALALKPDFYQASYNKGTILFHKGHYRKALQAYATTLDHNPFYYRAHNNRGLALEGLGFLEKARDAYNEALRIKPDYPEALNNRGNVFNEMEDLNNAIADYEEAIRIKPDFLEAVINLLELYEKTNRIHSLGNMLNAFHAHFSTQPKFILLHSKFLKRDHKYQEALSLLKSLNNSRLDTETSIEHAFLMGDLYDLINKTDEAFSCFERGNMLKNQTEEAKALEKRSYSNQIQASLSFFSNTSLSDLPDLQHGTYIGPVPVFLVGFPRSGTTLIDSILRSHPNVAVVEEKPAVSNLIRFIRKSPAGYPEGIRDMTTQEIQNLQHIYFEELYRHVDKNDRADCPVIIDKLPLNLVNAGLLHLIFPGARFIFSLRHPCDCILSCFMRNFKLNHAMINFMNLNDASNLYNNAMLLWELYRKKLNLSVHTIYYEKLVQDFETNVRALIKFLDLPWNDKLYKYIETAKKRPRINTPSYAQVTQPIYTQSLYRWKRYEMQIRSVLPVLSPWIKKHGYHCDDGL